MPPRIPWRSLRLRILAWSFVPTMIILVAVAVVIFYAYRDVTEELVMERNQELTRLAASQFVAELREYADLLHAEARISALSGRNSAAQRNVLQAASNRLVVFDAGTLILDTFGRVLAAEPERPEIVGQNWSDRAYYRQMLHVQPLGSMSWVVSDIVTDGPGDARVIVIAVPISGPEGELVGGIAGMFRVGATTFSAIYGDFIRLRLGSGGSAYLVDGQGQVIYHSDTDRIGDDLSAQGVVQQVLRGDVGAVRTRDLDNREIVASFAPVPGTSWGLVAEENWSTLIASSQGYRQFLFLLLVLGVAVPALVVAFGVSRITRPIAELARAAQEVARGNFAQRISAATGDELEEMAAQFNLMAAELQESYAHLEQRVSDRTKELATLNVISGVVSQSLDLNSIMSSALDKTMEVTQMEMGAIYSALVAGDSDGPSLKVVGYKLVASRGLSAEIIQAIDRIPLRNSAMEQAAALGRPYVWHVADVPPQAGLAELLEKEGMHFAISVPLTAKGQTVGGMNLGTRRSKAVTSEVLSLLAAIGQQVGMAVENARLYEAEQSRREESERRRQVAEGMREILAILNSRQTLHDMLDLIASHACRVLGSDAAALLRLDKATGLLGIQATCNLDPEYAAQISMPLGVGTAGRALAERQPVVISDTAEATVYLEAGGSDRPEIIPDLLKRLTGRFGALFSVPIIVKDEAHGAITFYYREPHSFSEEEFNLALSVADQAALALENARLREQAQQAAAMEERGRLARELHDSVTQSLYSVTMYTEAAARLMPPGHEAAAEHLRDARDTAQEALREMRLLIYQLRPPALEKGGLAVALQVRLDAVERRGGIHADLTVEGEDRLPPAIQGELHQIAQEALNNALKHAHTHRVQVNLRFSDAATSLEVRDDGVGFELAAARAGGGLGLLNMRERAEKIGGRLEIESAPGQGTKVYVQVPTGGGA